MAWLDWTVISGDLELYNKTRGTRLQIIKGVLDSGDVIAAFRNLFSFLEKKKILF